MQVSNLPENRTLSADTPRNSVKLGMIGLGTVGTGVYKILTHYPELSFQKISVRDLQKSRNLDDVPAELLTQDPFEVVRDPSIDLVIEVMGGVEVARELITEALTSGKHVVTANKELVAKHGPELFALARKHNVRLLFEGAVAGGIPIIMPLKLSLAGNRILAIAGILNGTTNFILTKMTQEGRDYQEVLKEAQAKGFAEADPTSDVEGHDAAYKISILASIAFNQSVEPAAVFTEGISKITALDIQNAASLGFAIKLIGLAQEAENGKVDVRVHPMLVPHTHPLASIHNENNAVWVKGDAVGELMFYGKGAGELPTASAVMGDVLAIAKDLMRGNDPIPSLTFEQKGKASMVPMTTTRNRYYIRLNTHDHPGVIGRLGTACGDSGVSLESVMQRGTGENGTASIVLITHEVLEEQMQSALTKIEAQASTGSVGCVLRVL